MFISKVNNTNLINFLLAKFYTSLIPFAICLRIFTISSTYLGARTARMKQNILSKNTPFIH